MSSNQKRYEIVEFEYIYVESDEVNYILLVDDVEFNGLKDERIEKAKVYIKKPSWYEMHEVYRLSASIDPYTKKKEIISEKIKENKLKLLLWKIEDHTGEVFYFNEETIGDLHCNLANFFLIKIAELVEKSGCTSSSTEEEERQLSLDCFKYYSAIKKKRAGRRVEIPTPPAIVVLRRICEMFHCLPDEARTISKDDIDKVFLASEQEFYCEDPKNVGM